MERRFGSKLLWGLGLPLGVLIAAASIVVGEVRGPLLALAFAFAGAAVLGGAIIATRRHLFLSHARLKQARTAAQRIAQGHFDRLPMVGDDEELDALALAFNSMRDVMENRVSGLREENVALTMISRRMEAVIDATDDGLALIDSEGYIVLVNRRFCDMIGLRRDAILLKQADEIKPAIEARFAQPEKVLRALVPYPDLGAGIVEDTVALIGDGASYQIYVSPGRRDNSDIAGQIVGMRDVTRERELDKMKTEFISVVSHELRTPLTSIKGYTDLLLNGMTGEINEIQREFLGILQGSATRLGNLINDMLDIARIESGRIDVKQEAVDYSRIVGDTLRMMRASADEKDIMLDASLPSSWPLVRGDADKITQVLTNLLSNAVKYTPAGGFVKVLVEVTGDSGITTCVVDTGIGISPEDQKQLFQKFFRADNSSTREAGGTGLGLVIVKTMVELLGGSIWLESETGRGSKFYFTLPLYNEAAAAAIDDDARQASANARIATDRGIGMVLVVEDDAFARDQLQQVLHRKGYSVLAVTEAKDAVPKAKVHRPNVILLDMMMPDMAAFKVIKSLRTSPMTRATPVIAYTMAGDSMQGEVALSAFAFMSKPVEPQEFAIALKRRRVSDPTSTVLLVASDVDESDPEVVSTVAALKTENICCEVASSSAQAITRMVTESVDAVMIDTDRIAEPALFELMRALKSEEDIARIPIVLLSSKTGQEGMHFHLGHEHADSATVLDYLVEQVGIAVK